MKKYKKWWITLGVVLILGLIVYIFWFVIPKNTANKAVDDYLAEQKITSNQIDTRVIKKDWKMGGYLTKIVFKDDPDLKYEYVYDERYEYPHHIYVVAFKDGSSQEDNQMKHPPLPEQLEEMNKTK
ncbi:DUF3139 domain-containing protein [Listeria ivanovii]|uniref:DUF3139 domain-containing protein n=2 Tax=Listeria ivanovii TaxID=1638 RepID=A0ABS1G2Q2_LISIV|nr:DUF3139 domain-containing protein [Listeria ivanovii]EFR98098.1 putative secreted protein [Listeria ivanovii FSL F6-596]AIS61080.1 hypothetical protein JL58_14360 [Listeria ivanovii subsp. londoniensis]AIS63898.1 hypothetical protein JL53_14790 [Listeria ivanovii subsp. londoniensis]MBC2256407.1 DUF3139 domain-containing protein [Listeria ivanovii]MBK1961070.1 DUF3139 domain-containing protein [Listeria ivanovii subsp. londoniensis]